MALTNLSGRNVVYHASTHVVIHRDLCRAYVTPKDRALLKSATFAAEIQEWIKDKASRHQHLRGGTFFGLLILIFLICILRLYAHTRNLSTGFVYG